MDGEWAVLCPLQLTLPSASAVPESVCVCAIAMLSQGTKKSPAYCYDWLELAGAVG